MGSYQPFFHMVVVETKLNVSMMAKFQHSESKKTVKIFAFKVKIRLTTLRIKVPRFDFGPVSFFNLSFASFFAQTDQWILSRRRRSFSRRFVSSGKTQKFIRDHKNPTFNRDSKKDEKSDELLCLHSQC